MKCNYEYFLTTHIASNNYLRYVFPAASVASDALRKPLGQCISTRPFCLERPSRLTLSVRRWVQIDARLFLNIDAVACGYLRCETYRKHYINDGQTMTR